MPSTQSKSQLSLQASFQEKDRTVMSTLNESKDLNALATRAKFQEISSKLRLSYKPW